MLRITKSYSSASVIQYFSASLVQEGYYLKDEVNSVWRGSIAQWLSLDGELVTKEVFKDLVNNIHPHTKERLTQRNVENRKAGFDFTFSAPKSVSILHSLTDAPEILESHQCAYRAAMEAVERDMQCQANRGKRRIYQSTGAIIYSAYDHFTSRPVKHLINGEETYIPDPQLHTHCYMPNVTWDAEKKRFVALEIGNIHRLASYYEAIYHSTLSDELKKHGYQIRQTKDRWEVLGVPQAVIRAFSNRSEEIDKLAEEKNLSAKAKAQLGATTRHSKSMSVAESELVRLWQARLSPDELHHLNTLKDNSQASREQAVTTSPHEALQKALDHYSERSTGFQEKRVIAHALSLGYGDLLVEDVEQALKLREDILYSEYDTVSIITTKALVKAENRLIELAAEGKGRFLPLHPNYEVKQSFLSNEQQAAIHTLLNSHDQFTLLKGSAGSGKTTILKELVSAIEEQGCSCFAVAPSTQSVNVLKQNGLEADTVAGLLHKSDHEHLRDNVLIIDEATLSGVQTTTKLLELCKQYGSRAILSGDIYQHQAPGQYGDALRILQNKAQLKTANIEQIIRQKPDDYRKAVSQLSQGNVGRGFDALDKMGVIKEVPEQEHLIDEISEGYVQSVEKGRTALIVTPTHAERKLINETVRQKLFNSSKLKGKEYTLPTLENLSLSEAQKKELKSYEEGMVLRFVKNKAGGYKAGQHLEVVREPEQAKLQIKCLSTGEKYPLPIDASESYQLYRKAEINVRKGDIIKATCNGWNTDRSSKVTNGTSYTIAGFTKDSIKTDTGKEIPKDYYHLTHAYSETSHAAQGKTCKDVFISISDMSYSAASKQQLYVSASRGTDSITLYTPNKEDLRRAVMKSEEQISAKDIERQHNERELARRQQRHYDQLINEPSRTIGNYGPTRYTQRQVSDKRRTPGGRE